LLGRGAKREIVLERKRQSGVPSKTSIHINIRKRQEGLARVTCIVARADGLRSAHLANYPSKVWRSPWRRVRCRSNREKKKPKQDKNKKKGDEASSPLAGMHSQVKLGTSYMSQRAPYDFGDGRANMSGLLRDRVRR